MKKSAVIRVATCLLAWFFLPFWYLEKLFKRDSNLWLFGSMNNKTDSDNCFVFFKYLHDNHKDKKIVWVTRFKVVYDKLLALGYNVMMANSREGKKACLKAGVAFISQGAAETNKKYINGIKQVFLWHGMPMKIIGCDAEKHENARISRTERALRRLEKFSLPYLFNNKPTLFISTSDFFAPIFASAFKINEKNVIPLGQPRNDVFFFNKSESIVNQLNIRFNNPLKIFFMPTFRDNLTASGKQFNPFDNFNFSAQKFNSFLEKNNVVCIYKGHNHEGIVNIFNQLGERFVIVSPQNCEDPYTLLKDIDILMTDYSSVYFDFLLLKKPVILATFDYDDYLKESRPFYFDYKKEIDGVKVNDWNEFMDVVENQRYYIPSEETCNKFHKFSDGKSSERLFNYLSENLH